MKLIVRKRLSSTGMNSSAECSFFAIVEPLIAELKSNILSFPRTVVYSKLNLCGLGYELAAMDKEIKGHVSQYHSVCTEQVTIFIISSIVAFVMSKHYVRPTLHLLLGLINI